MGMTMTEKILARRAGRGSVAPGENIWVDVDVLMTHDVCGPGTIGIFKQQFGDSAKVWDPDRVVIIPDHYIFTAEAICHRNVQILRDFVKEQGIRYYYDPEFVTAEPTMPNPYRDPEKTSYKGVCHKALPEEGHLRPGEILLGTDSHTCTAGAFGQFATGVGNTDAAFTLGTGKTWLKVPPTMKFVFHGEIPPYLTAKDLILAVIGARLYHVFTPSPSMAEVGITSPADYFRNPMQLINLRRGGLGIYGGIAGGALGLLTNRAASPCERGGFPPPKTPHPPRCIPAPRRNPPRGSENRDTPDSTRPPRRFPRPPP